MEFLDLTDLPDRYVEYFERWVASVRARLERAEERARSADYPDFPAAHLGARDGLGRSDVYDDEE